MKKYEFTGKKLDTTIDEALKTLNKQQEDVDINILCEGGLFKKCKIEVIVQDDEPVLENQKIEQETASESADAISENETTVTLVESDEKEPAFNEETTKEETIISQAQMQEEPSKTCKTKRIARRKRKKI